MMKKMIAIVLLFVLASTGEMQSQQPTVREEISNINSLLKANPYRDTFLEITFYYSIDITTAKELVVNMDFDGPFSTSLKASILDLERTQRVDTALEGTSSVCWYCKSDTIKGAAPCVYCESTTKEGEKQSHFTDNICVMISRKSEIREALIKAFDQLFKSVLEE
jgi:hypothetical protein